MNTYANAMHMMTWYEMHDMNKMQNERQNPTTEGISYHIAENGKSRSYKYGKLHAGCYTCQLAEEADLSFYQASYDTNNKRVAAPTPGAQNLIPPIRKHTYALDIEPPTLISDEAVFQALTGIDWTTIDFQPLGRDEEDEPVQDDPQSSGQAGDQS